MLLAAEPSILLVPIVQIKSLATLWWVYMLISVLWIRYQRPANIVTKYWPGSTILCAIVLWLWLKASDFQVISCYYPSFLFIPTVSWEDTGCALERCILCSHISTLNEYNSFTDVTKTQPHSLEDFQSISIALQWEYHYWQHLKNFI